MRISALSFPLLAVSLIVAPTAAQTGAGATAGGGRPLEERVGPAPQAFFDMLGLPDARPRALTAEEREEVRRALSYLTPLQRRFMDARLNEISFVEGMPNNGLTYPNPNDPTKRSFNITLRAGVLDETISELVTRKERSCFDTTGSPLSLSIEAGDLPALVYVFLHEATHIVDSSLGLTTQAAGNEEVRPSSMTEDIWESRLMILPRYREPLLAESCYRARGVVHPIAQARALYQALGRTPFASLYGSSNWHDDLAELLTWYDLTQRLGQPYRIEVRDGASVTFSYEPMTSPLVRARFPQLERFFRIR